MNQELKCSGDRSCIHLYGFIRVYMGLLRPGMPALFYRSLMGNAHKDGQLYADVSVCRQRNDAG
ncbi:hypothetical protein SAMN05428949_1744 [Chitinophaga sp. YR627]|nr:hypothetical protein SAMN05428949_1744 [Chitinophaga sp. YR627]